MNVIYDHGRTWELDELPPKSIALDGAVRGPVLDTAAQRLSFDHHDSCVRLVTSATCQQVLDALSLGFDPTGWDVYVNDVDGDTALSVALLRNPHWVGSDEVHDLVYAVGRVDAHGPAVRLAGRHRRVANAFYRSVMSPETEARRSGTYGSANHVELLDTCVARIEAFVAGGVTAASQRETAQFYDDRTYTVVHEGNGWVMVSSKDFVFDLIYADGYDAAVAYQDLSDGSRAYTVAKRSDLVSFDVTAILANLNEREPGWGGGSSIGGAPRNAGGSRSRLTPDTVIEVVTLVTAR